jgi:hypothetical protein
MPCTMTMYFRTSSRVPEYLGRFTRAALDRVHDRFLVVDDLPAIIQRGGEEWDHENRE